MIAEIGLIFSTVLFFLLVYYKATRCYGIFREKGFPEEKGSFPFGSKMFWDHYLNGRPLKDYPSAYRWKYPTERFFISWHLQRPWIFILEKELGKRMLEEDEHIFMVQSRGRVILDNAERRYCRILHSKMSNEKNILEMEFVAISLKNLENLLPDFYHAADDVLEYLSQAKSPSDARSLMGKYAMQSIVRVALGIKGDCFEKTSKVMTFIPPIRRYRGIMGWLLKKGAMALPKGLSKLIPLSNEDSWVQKSFKALIERSISNGRRADILLDNLRLDPLSEIDEELLLSYVCIGLLLDFKATNNLLKSALEILAIRTNVQEGLRRDILEKGEAVMEFETFLELESVREFINALKMHIRPLLLKRRNLESYRIPGTTLQFPAGTVFVFPHDVFEDSDDGYELDGQYMALNTGSKTSMAKEFALLALKVLLIRTLPFYNIILNKKRRSKICSTELETRSRVWVQFERRDY